MDTFLSGPHCVCVKLKKSGSDKKDENSHSPSEYILLRKPRGKFSKCLGLANI